MKKLLFLVFPLGLILSLPVSADQYNPRLNQLFLNLQSTRDAVLAAQIESTIWQIWHDHDNPEYQAVMNRGLQQMNNNSPYAALNEFDRLIEIAPNFSEAWNRRATIYFQLKNYKASLADIEQTLLLEPKHFGALSGKGLVYMAQGEYFLARTAFYSALEVHPNMRSIDYNLDLLEEIFNQTAI